jgi:Kef-type K+ transport system membrane component KefB
VIDDILGIVLLALVQTLGQEGSISVGVVAWSLIAAFGFLGVALFLGQWAAPALITLVDRARVRGMLITVAIAFAFTLGLLADLSGSAPLIGAMAAGMLLARTHRREVIEAQIRPIADLFTPIFFVSVGAGVNLALLTPFDPNNWSTLALAFGLIGIAIVGKLAAGLGTQKGNRLVVGVGMIPRGEVGLIFAGVGRSAGILNPALFGAVVAMVLVTTVIVPPLLRVVFDRQDRISKAASAD